MCLLESVAKKKYTHIITQYTGLVQSSYITVLQDIFEFTASEWSDPKFPATDNSKMFGTYSNNIKDDWHTMMPDEMMRVHLFSIQILFESQDTKHSSRCCEYYTYLSLAYNFSKWPTIHDASISWKHQNATTIKDAIVRHGNQEITTL